MAFIPELDLPNGSARPRRTIFDSESHPAPAELLHAKLKRLADGATPMGGYTRVSRQPPGAERPGDACMGQVT